MSVVSKNFSYGESRRSGLPPSDEGSEATRAAMNDSPVDCQNREWTEPQRDGGFAVGEDGGRETRREESLPQSAYRLPAPSSEGAFILSNLE